MLTEMCVIQAWTGWKEGWLKSFFEYLQAAASQSHPVNALIVAVVTWYLPDQKVFNTVLLFFFFGQKHFNVTNTHFVDLLQVLGQCFWKYGF